MQIYYGAEERPIMSYIEATIISQDEYNASEDKRLLDNELIIDELYIGMFALAKNIQRSEAAKLPVRLKSTQRREPGIYIATLGILDDDLRETVVCKASFNNGYWTDVRKSIVINHIPPLQSYLKSYETPFEADALDVTTSINLQDRELALV